MYICQISLNYTCDLNVEVGKGNVRLRARNKLALRISGFILYLKITAKISIYAVLPLFNTGVLC